MARSLQAGFWWYTSVILCLDKTKRISQEKFIKITKENAVEIRDKVLKYLMVRRTRTEIERYFPDDLSKQGLKFPEVVQAGQLL